MYRFCRSQLTTWESLNRVIKNVRKKEKNAEFLESQKGAIGKFVRKKPKLSLGNQSGDADSSSLALAIVPYIDPRDGQTETENNVEVEEDHINLNTSPVEAIEVLYAYYDDTTKTQ